MSGLPVPQGKNPPEYRQIYLGEIGTPGFQRPPIETLTKRIARNFNWNLFLAVVVFTANETDPKRGIVQGGKYVIDGLQRLTGLRKSGVDPSTTVPALVYDDLTYEEAAIIFHEIGRPGNRRGLSPGDLMRAELEAADERAWDIADRIEALGLTLDLSSSLSNRSYGVIRAIAAIRAVYRSGGEQPGEHLTRILTILKDGFPEDQQGLSQHMILGMHYFVARYGNIIKDREIAMKLNGTTAGSVLRRASAMAEALRQSKERANYVGRALLIEVNSGRRANRLPEWDTPIKQEEGA